MRVPGLVCGTCGRTTATRVWSRAGWEDYVTMTQRRQVGGKTRPTQPKTPWPVRLGLIHDLLRLPYREIAQHAGSSPRTLEGWRSGAHLPDRRARAALKPLWIEAKRRQAAASVSTQAPDDEVDVRDLGDVYGE